MAYAGKDQVSLVSGSISGTNGRVWLYWNDEEDADATIVGSGYFSDGYTLGMRVGDLVMAIEKPTAKYKMYQVASESDPAVTVAAPTTIS